MMRFVDHIYLALQFHADDRNRDLVARISDTFEACGVATVRVARDFEHWGETRFQPEELMRVSLDAIDRSSAVVVEFSEKGVGRGIEAGYATAHGIPVFVIHQPEAEVSVTVHGVAPHVFQYTDADSLADAARRITPQISPLSD